MKQKYLLFFSAVVLVGATVTFSDNTLAGRYELVQGKGVEVCEAYETNLNSFHPKLPMGSGRPVNPEMKDLAKPKWAPPEHGLAPNGTPIVIAFGAFSEWLWQRDVNYGAYFERGQWRGTPAQYREARKHYDVDRERRWKDGNQPLLADFDIDNDGEIEHVYFEYQAGSVYGDLLVVLTPDYRAIDRKKTERITPHPPFKKMGFGYYRPVKKGDWGIPPDWVKRGFAPVEDAISDVHYDAFFYKGKTYIDQWWTNHPDFKGKSDMDAGWLRVFMATPASTDEICTYRFNYEG